MPDRKRLVTCLLNVNCSLQGALNAVYLRWESPARESGETARSEPVLKADSIDLLPEETCVSVEERVIEIVSNQLSVPKEEITRASSFVEDLKADSLDVVEL